MEGRGPAGSEMREKEEEDKMRIMNAAVALGVNKNSPLIGEKAQYNPRAALSISFCPKTLPVFPAFALRSAEWEPKATHRSEEIPFRMTAEGGPCSRRCSMR